MSIDTYGRVRRVLTERSFKMGHQLQDTAQFILALVPVVGQCVWCGCETRGTHRPAILLALSEAQVHTAVQSLPCARRVFFVARTQDDLQCASNFQVDLSELYEGLDYLRDGVAARYKSARESSDSDYFGLSS